MDAVIIDYGIVNLKNVVRGFEHLGSKVTISKHPEVVEKAERVVLPGVGAFSAGIQELRKRGLDEALGNVANAGRPVLGICLGMQMLLDNSLEYGKHEGLGLIPGSVIPIPTESMAGGRKDRKVPHIGWSRIDYPPNLTNWDGSCLSDTLPSTYFYFVHSFMVVPDDPNHILARCNYENVSLCGAIRKGNITGLQFHPERSGTEGLNVLRKFITS